LFWLAKSLELNRYPYYVPGKAARGPVIPRLAAKTQKLRTFSLPTLTSAAMSRQHWLCVCHEYEPNDAHPCLPFQGLTVARIMDGPLQERWDPGYLAIVTPDCRLRLPPTCQPLKDYPEIILPTKPESYPPTRFHLAWVPNEDQSDLVIYMDVQTQMKTTFPRIGVPFTFREVEMLHVSEVLGQCLKVFKYECTNARLRRAGRDVDPKARAKDVIRPPCKDHGLVFVCEVSEKDQKKINHRIFHCEQMVSTETAFLNDINELSDYWKPAISRYKLFNDDQFQTLFQNLDPIIGVHRMLLDQMKGMQISFATEFASLFLNFASAFKIGAPFVSKFKQMDALIKDNCQNKNWLLKWQEVERGLPSGSGRDFLSYYVTPVQRYPRYPLLLRDLDKATPDFHPDKGYIQEAINVLDNVNKDIDQTSAKANRMEDLTVIQNLFGSELTIMAPGRDLQVQTEMRFIKPRSAAGILYLFNDMIVLAYSYRKPYQAVIAVPLTDFRFANNRPSSDSIFFILQEREYVVQFNDLADKNGWFVPFTELRQRQLDGVFSKKGINLAKWTDLEVRDGIPALMNHDGCYFGNSAWFFGGTTASLADSNFLIQYNFESHLWQQIPTSIPARNSHTFTACGDAIYLACGTSKKDCLNDVWKYTDLANLWELLKLTGDTIPKRCGHSCVAVDHLLVIFGGRTHAGKFLSDICIINTETLWVERLRNLKGEPSGRCNHSAVFLPNTREMVIIGGRTQKAIVGDVHVFRIDTREWREEEGVVLDGRMNHKCCSLDQWLVAFGGRNALDSDQMAWIDTTVWKESLAMQYGNKPFGLSRFAIVKKSNTKYMTFGGMDHVTKTPFASCYVLELFGGSVERAKAVQRPKPGSEPQTTPNQPEAAQELQAPATELPPPRVQLQPPPRPVQPLRPPPSYGPSHPPLPRFQPFQLPSRPQAEPPLPFGSELPPSRPEHQLPCVPEARELAPIGRVCSMPPSATAQSRIAPSPGTPPISHLVCVQPPPPTTQPLTVRFSCGDSRSPDMHGADPGQPETALQSGIRRVVSTPSCRPASVQVSRAVGSFGVPDAFITGLNVELDQLMPFEQAAAKMKLKRLWQLTEANQQIEEEIAQKQAVISGVLPPDTQVFLKVFDDLTQKYIVLRVSAGQEAADLMRLINAKLGRDAMLSIEMRTGKAAPFNDNSLRDAQARIACKEAIGLALSAV
jgi:hypothetical protein